MNKEIKQQIVQELQKSFESHETYYVVDFKRMNVSQSVALRKLLRENSHSFRVVKNRLALKAIAAGCPEPLKTSFEKSTALAFTDSDPIGLAKTLKDFSAQGKVLAIKGGVLEGQYLTPEQFDDICRLNSRNDVLGKIGFLMAYPLSQFLRALRAPLSQLGLMMDQLKSKK